MKFSFFTLALFFTSFICQAQFTIDVNGIYFERAAKKFNSQDLKQADIYFERAIRYDSVIDDSSIAKMGTMLYYDLEKVELAQSYAKRYFELKTNNTTEEYKVMKALYAEINILCERKALEKELKQLKSLVFVKNF